MKLATAADPHMNGDGINFNIAALALAAGTFWGAAILLVSVANLLWPDYGRLFLDLAGSMYPGYQPGGGAGSVIVGTLYGFVDGAVAGAVIGWMYNTLAAAMRRRSYGLAHASRGWERGQRADATARRSAGLFFPWSDRRTGR